jgi:hypothetical protein
MNIEPNGTIFNAEGLNRDYSPHDNSIRNMTPPRKSHGFAFPADFTTVKANAFQGKSIKQCPIKKTKPISWDDIYDKDRERKNHIVMKIEPPGPFVGNAFSSSSDDMDWERNPINDKKKYVMSLDKAKNRSRNTTVITNVSAKSPKEKQVVRKAHENSHIEPVVLSWCRTAEPSKLTGKIRNSSFQESEATSTTTATSTGRSIEPYDTQYKLKRSSTPRNVSRRRSICEQQYSGNQVVKQSPQKSRSYDYATPGDFEVNWSNTETSNCPRQNIHFTSPNDYPNKETSRSTSTKRSTSNGRSLRRCSIANANHMANKKRMEQGDFTPSISEKHISPSKVKPRLYMTVSSPKKKVNKLMSKNLPSDLKCSNKNVGIGSFEFGDQLYGDDKFNLKGSKKTAARNTEPLDFSEFDTEDFSTNDDFCDVFPPPFQPILPLYYTSNTTSTCPTFFQANDKSNDDEWSSLFSPTYG